jgi:hypothetical protein
MGAGQESANLPVNPCKGGRGESEILKKIKAKARNRPEIIRPEQEKITGRNGKITANPGQNTATAPQ